MPGNLFMKIDGVECESLQKGWEKWSEVTDVRFGLEQRGTAGSNTGLSGGKADYDDITVTKNTDIGSAKLMLFGSNGKHLTSVKISALKQTGKGTPEEYYTIELTDVLVSGFSTGLGEDGSATDTIRFNFAAIKMAYKSQTNTGALGKGSEMKWDVKAGTGG